MSSDTKDYRLWNVFFQNTLLITSLALTVSFYNGYVSNVVAPYIYKMRVVDPDYKTIWLYKKDDVVIDSPPQALRFQALAQAGCLDQQYYIESVANVTFQEIGNAPNNYDADFTDYFDAQNWQSTNTDLVCQCINSEATKHNLTAGTFRKTLRDKCFNGKYMSIYAVSAYETRAYTDHNSNGFYRFIIGLNFLLFYAWSLSTKSLRDVCYFAGDFNALWIFFILSFVSIVTPLFSIAVDIFFFTKATKGTQPSFELLVWVVFWIGVTLKFLTASVLLFPLYYQLYKLYKKSNSSDTSSSTTTATTKFVNNTFVLSASLRTFMDYFFVFGGAITLVYAMIMAGVASLSSICTLFILSISLFYSVHASFFMRNQLDIVMSNLDNVVLAYLQPAQYKTTDGNITLSPANISVIERGFRPFANSLVMARLSYLFFTIFFLLSIVFMIRDTPLGVDSYLVSYQINWVVLIFLTLCAFSYDFFNEIQQKIIKYADHDIIIYAVLFITFQVFYLFTFKS